MPAKIGDLYIETSVIKLRKLPAMEKKGLTGTCIVILSEDPTKKFARGNWKFPLT